VPKDLWLPRGHALPDGGSAGALLHTGEDWQIYENKEVGSVLVVRPALCERWFGEGLAGEEDFGTLPFGDQIFHCLSSPKQYTLQPVCLGMQQGTKANALAFANSLRESREICPDAHFHDALFVERLTRLLPTWTLSLHRSDEEILGTWVTGGVAASTNAFRRLHELTAWMPQADLTEVIQAAGLCTPSRLQPLDASNELETCLNADSRSNHLEDQAVDSSSVHFSLPGRPHLESFFNEHVIDIIVHSERYEALGIEFPSAIVLHGPPGCGKTFAVERLVEYLDWPYFPIDSNSVGSPFIHDTSKKISEVFDRAIDSAPSVVVIDEMEAFLTDRRAGAGSGLHHVEEVAEFLRRIPEAIKSKVLIIAMTNLIDMVDPAILRRGRFDHIIEVGMPSREEVNSLLESLLEKIPTAENLDIDRLADALTGKPLSDGAFVIREAARLAARSGKNALDQESIESAVQCVPVALGSDSGRIGFTSRE